MKRTLLVLALMLTCSGCIHMSTLITLKPDGSGTIDQEIGMNPQALSMLAAFGGNGRGMQQQPGRPDDIFNEQKAREQAEKMGVKFVSGTPVDTPSLKGYRARFSFDDIKSLKVRMEDARAMRGDSNSRQDPFDFEFAKRASTSTLTIHIPQDVQRPPLAQLGGGNGQMSQEQAQAMVAMMRPMFAGMFVDVSLAIDGRIVRTNAPFVDGNRITLVQLDMDKVINDETAWTKLQNATTPADMRNILGVKVSTQPTLTIEFGK
jgi:hypothetical protein